MIFVFVLEAVIVIRIGPTSERSAQREAAWESPGLLSPENSQGEGESFACESRVKVKVCARAESESKFWMFFHGESESRTNSVCVPTSTSVFVFDRIPTRMVRLLGIIDHTKIKDRRSRARRRNNEALTFHPPQNSG